MSRRDTIAAIATAPGRAALGVVRVSGENLAAFAESLTGRKLTAREATLATFRDAAGSAIDQGIALFFAAPRSYTGQDVLELHGHGGIVVLRLVLQRCLELGARIAEPGEFSQRAFWNGKLDLIQAESVIDLIDAGTAESARGAMRSLQGEFSSRIRALAERLVELRALVEATLDFPEEEIDALASFDTRAKLAGVADALDAVLDAARQGAILREGLQIVIAGAPNVGKSSLLNKLSGEDVAIVTDIPGTTRDPIRQVLDLGGIPAHVVDTAGLRDTVDPVERIGVERAWGAIELADVVVVIVDATNPDSAVTFGERLPSDVRRISVMNKIDLTGDSPRIEEGEAGTTVWVSAKTGAGLDLLREAFRAIAGWRGTGESVFLARERHLRLLVAAKAHVEAAAGETRVELVAEELRLAHDALARITGAYSADDLLGEIFQRFCIGK